ncbi:uncharacterized protein LOC124119931 [Haliotis rufescens]|uniref:uncharacterized protein LOC124119931 n=1 Tax=Haliotis rufescens TaxID=6454 RepID=UPI00201E9B7A|nr:uncharacterized protein LOC124119931 [Haliotis rufescens]XP_046338564.2 uncharacterized protein LOC124119931 [Haliotis rufescens]
MAEPVASKTIAFKNLCCSNCEVEIQDLVILSCYHAICKTCLKTGEQIRDEEKSVTLCPVCKTEVTSAAGPNALRSQLNTCISRVFGLLGNGLPKTETSNCSICCLRNQLNEATHQCLDCADVLCDLCQKGHNASRITHAHRVVAIEDVKSGKYVVTAQTTLPCSNSAHKRANCAYFCQICVSPMCEYCLLFEHKGHQILPLEEASRQCGKQLEERSEKLDTYLAEVTSMLEKSSSRRGNIIASREATLNTLREKTQAMVESLQKQEQEAVEKVTRLCENQLLLVSTMNHKLEQITNLCPKVLSLTHSVLEAREDLQFLLLCKDLEKCFEESEHLQDSIETFAIKWKIPKFKVQCDFPNNSVIGVKQSFVSPQLLQGESKERGVLSGEDSDRRQIISATSGGKHSNSSLKAEENSTLKQAQPTGPQKLKGGNKQHMATKDELEVCSNGILTTDTFLSNDTNWASASSKLDAAESPEDPEDVFHLAKSLVIVAEEGKMLTNSFPRHPTTVKCKEPGRGIGSRLEEGDVRTSQGRGVPMINPVLRDIGSPLDGQYVQSAVPENTCRTQGRSNGVGSLRLEKTKVYHLRVVNDETDPEIKGLAVALGNTTIADNGNKKIRLIDKKGHSANMSKNVLKDNIPTHALVHLGHMVVYICGACIYIADKSLRAQRVVPLEISKSASQGLILCKYTDTSFMVGNLPENLVRVYNSNGQLTSVRKAPVDGPINAMSLSNEEHVLFSCPGAVFQIQKYGNLSQVFKPPNVPDWYPEGTCVDKRNNLYVANPRQNRIHVFSAGGEQLYLHSTLSDNLVSPRCLAISSNRLFVSGNHPHLFVFTILDVDK